MVLKYTQSAVADPGLQIRWGDGHPDLKIRGVVSKKIVSALWATVGSKNTGGNRDPWAPSLDPPLIRVNVIHLYKKGH